MSLHRIPASWTTPLSTVGVVLCLWLVLGFASAGAAESGRTSVLHDELRATVVDDGSVALWTDRWFDDRSLLRILPPWSTQRRRAAVAANPPILELTHEGDERGRRGFSRHADDDGDGRVDEDRLDGMDNDGDGLIDEDFAAVGDAMHVVHLSGNESSHHLETYHWDYRHLQETLVVSWTVDDGPTDAVLRLPEGFWREARVGWGASKPGAADPSSRALAVARLSGEGRDWWLGVSVLEGGPVLRMDAGELRVSVDGRVTIAVTVAPTLTRLRGGQAVAHVLREGARSAPNQEPVPWIVPPLVRVPEGLAPVAHHHNAPDGALVITVELPDGWPLIIDPESFRIADLVLGEPRSFSWSAPEASGMPETDWLPWNTTKALREEHVFATLADRRDLGGTWTFTFPPSVLPTGDDPLSFESVCGRPSEVVLEDAPTPDEIPLVAAQDDSDEEADRIPTLAPHLLENYPNPFVDHLQIRFKIPETVGEGFVWGEDEEPLLAPSDPIPYTSDQPRVTLKIYNVAGHEVAAVFDEPCGPGERTAHWNGLDPSGRPVATGTYFCKLQIENWSVTKRVALIR